MWECWLSPSACRVKFATIRSSASKQHLVAARLFHDRPTDTETHVCTLMSGDSTLGGSAALQRQAEA